MKEHKKYLKEIKELKEYYAPLWESTAAYFNLRKISEDSNLSLLSKMQRIASILEPFFKQLDGFEKGFENKNLELLPQFLDCKKSFETALEKILKPPNIYI